MSFGTTAPDGVINQRKRGAARACAAALAFGVILGGGSAIAPLPGSLFASEAEAVSKGAGQMYYGGNLYVGSFINTDGSIVYCAEIGLSAEMGANHIMGQTSTLRAFENSNLVLDDGTSFGHVYAPELTAGYLQLMNFVVGKYGATNDPVQAQAVQIAVWEIRAEGANSNYLAMLDYAKAGVGAGIIQLSQDMLADARAMQHGAAAPADPRIIPGLTPYTGSVEVDPGTTSLTIENGIFPSTGTNSITFDGLTETTQVQFQGVPPHDAESWDRHYPVTVNGTYSYTAASSDIYFGLSVENPNGQGMVQGIPLEQREGDFQAQYLDPDTIWSPVLTTQVPSVFVKEGEKFEDTVTFGVAEGSNEWRWGQAADGTVFYAPITAKGTLYGPYLTDPALNPSGTVPNGAPVAATAEVTTSVELGPGTYEVASTERSEEAGYYTWVWNIEFDDQDAGIQTPKNGNPSIPVNYYFTDGFGQASEGLITPSDISFSTELSKSEVALNGTFTDDISVKLNKGGWLQTDGKRTPFKLRGSVYTTPEKPNQSTDVPADATLIDTTFVTTTGPDQVLTSDIVTIPLNTDDNYVTLQWCLLDEDQEASAAGKANEFCDDFGVPAETAEIVKPEVTTQAQPTGAVKGDIKDTAIVTGKLPEGDVKAEIDFTAYLKPEAGEPKYDENWEPILDESGEPVLWTEEEVSDPEAVCDAQPVGKTERVEAELGEVDSPSIKAETEGTVYWVEELFFTPEDGDEISFHRGKCGLPNETTEVEKPKVTTKATPDALPGDKIHDTAIVEGPLSEREEVSYEVTFEAYHRESGTTVEPNEDLCTVDTKVWESESGTKVTEAGEWKSEEMTVKPEHVGEILWVETLWLKEKNEQGEEEKTELHRGKCGEADEITRVRAAAAAAANTGSNTAAMIGWGAAGILVLAAAGATVLLRNRKKSTTHEETATPAE